MAFESRDASESKEGIVEGILSHVLSDGTLMLIILDYLQMGTAVDTLDEWIKEKETGKDKRFNFESDPLIEPWLQAIAELCQHEQQQLVENFLSDTNIPAMYLWFIAMTAAKVKNKKLVLSLLGKLDPRNVWKQECAETKRVVIYSWLYIIWRLLVNLDENKRHEEQWQDVAFRRVHEYSSGDGWTFLHFAAAWGDAKCVEELMELDCAEVDVLVNATTKRTDYTPLHLAAYHGNACIVRSLLQRTTAAQNGYCEQKDSAGRTALHHASERGCLDAVKALLQHKDRFDVDAVDKHGMTPLHLAACRRHTAVVQELLLSESAHPDLQCNVNYQMVRKLFITRLLRDRRERVWSTRFSVSEPELEACYAPNAVFLEPNQLQSEVWCPQGFNALHFAVFYGDNDTVRVILKHAKREDVLVAGVAKDSLGLTPADWAEAMDALQESEGSKGDMLLKEDLASKDNKSSLLVKAGLVSINLEKAKERWHQVREAEQERRKLQWAVDVSEAILSRRWAAAKCITSRGVADGIRIDDDVWDHLDQAILAALKFHRCSPTDNRKLLVERMLMELVNGGAFGKSSSVIQKCLYWAIKQEMVHLVKEIVRNTAEAGDLLTNIGDMGTGRKSVVQKSPLEAASQIKGSRGQEMVAAIEEQAEVKRLLLEGRQVYVEYSNTILVGAVLVAALAFQGWVQTPQGYAGMPLDSASKGMLLFARSNSLGFFFAMGAFMAGAVGAMPPKSGEFVKYRGKVIRAACVASLLMAAAVVSQVLGFASALVSVQATPGSHRNEEMLVSSRFGVAIICILSGWFLSRLNNMHNVVGLILEALPRTILYIVMFISFRFWRQSLQSRKFRRFVLYPLYGSVLQPLAPLLDSPPCVYLRAICPTDSVSQFTQLLKSKAQALRNHFDSWLQRQEDIYEGREGQPIQLDSSQIQLASSQSHLGIPTQSYSTLSIH